MKQPKLKVTDLQGNEVVVYPVASITWRTDGSLLYVAIQNLIITEHIFFYNVNNELVEGTDQLKGELIYE